MDYYVYLAVAIFVIWGVWHMPLPNRRWGNANQSFSDVDEKITQRDSVFE